VAGDKVVEVELLLVVILVCWTPPEDPAFFNPAPAVTKTETKTDIKIAFIIFLCYFNANQFGISIGIMFTDCFNGVERYS
jgi:hypothetical protein